MKNLSSHRLINYYHENQTQIEYLWIDDISYKEMGSGEDRIKITDSMFWEFVDNLMEKEA